MCNFENIQDDYIYPQKKYWGDEFVKHRGTFDIAKISYSTNAFKVKFGRDYFMPGVYFYENLLFSKYNYSYDQLGFEYHNDYITISSYYLALNSTRDTLTYNRHLNVHRFSINLGNGYIAFNDVMLYGGYKQNIDIMAFNPFILLYPYRKNKSHLDGNNIMSLEFFYQFSNYFIFTEFLLDDWQADKKVLTDLEPTEWGLNATFGINEMIRNLNWKVNYTHVANRTFNAPDHYYEKFIHKNYPIGHFLGNNFWELKSTFSYNVGDSWNLDFTLFHLEYGEEALYSDFNLDFTDANKYTVKSGYDENFPFGTVKKQTGVDINSFYIINNNFLTNTNLSYWINNSRLKSEFSFSFGLAYRLKLYK